MDNKEKYLKMAELFSALSEGKSLQIKRESSGEWGGYKGLSCSLWRYELLARKS